MSKEKKVIIVDDEYSAREVIKEMLDLLYPSTFVVLAEADNYEDAVRILNTSEPDLLFMDVSLRDNKSGFDVLNSLNNTKPVRPIFITAHEQHALKAFQYQTIGYLLKPIVMEEFRKVVNWALAENELVPLNQMQDMMKTIQDSSVKRKKVILADRSGWRVVYLDEIVYLQAQGSYCSIHLSSLQVISSSRNMKSIEEQIGENNELLKVHKSYTINKRHAISYDSPRNVLIMSNGEEVPVSMNSRELMQAIL